jgi:hypothetical protein
MPGESGLAGQGAGGVGRCSRVHGEGDGAEERRLERWGCDSSRCGAPPDHPFEPDLLRMGSSPSSACWPASASAFFLSRLTTASAADQIEEGTGLTVHRASLPSPRSCARTASLKTALVTAEKPNRSLPKPTHAARQHRFANADRKIRLHPPPCRRGQVDDDMQPGCRLRSGGSCTLIVDADMRRPST